MRKGKESLNPTDLGTYDGGPGEALTERAVETPWSTHKASERNEGGLHFQDIYRCKEKSI